MRDVLQRLVEPEATPGFRARVRDEIATRDRRALARWRGIAAVLAAASVAAGTAAGVLALDAGSTMTVDATVSCPLPIQGGVPAFTLYAGWLAPALLENTLIKKSVPPGMGVSIGASRFALAAIWSGRSGYTVDHSVCTRVTTPIPLAPSGLPLDGVYAKKLGLGDGWGDSCLPSARIVLRLRVEVDRSGQPLRARLAVRTPATHRPIAYVDWARGVSRVYVSDLCRTN